MDAGGFFGGNNETISNRIFWSDSSAKVALFIERGGIPSSTETNLLAMLFHSFWNGSSWLVSIVFADAHDAVFLIAILGWTVFLIVGLWLITRKILPTALS